MPRPRWVPGIARTLLVCAVLVSSPAGAAEYSGQSRTFIQPDGTAVEVLLYGTEFYLRAESVDGYTLMHEPLSGRIVYAVPNADGALVPGPVAYQGSANGALESTLAALGIVKGLRPDGTVARAIARNTQAALGKGTVPAWADGGLSGMSFHAPSKYSARLGTGKGLVVLVDFSDRPGNPPATEFEKAFNGDTYDALGSIRSWIETISYKKYSATHQVIGYMRAAYPTSHYVGGVEFDYSASAELMKQVYAYIDKEIDLTPLATNGSLPSLVVIYPGAEIAKVWATGLWPHAGEGGYTTSERVRIPNAFISNAGTATALDLDTFRHELGHSLFGWPDTYDYDNDSKSGGGYATETTWPCAPFRMWSGWISVVDIAGLNQRFLLEANGDTCLRYNNPANSSEYFVMEYMKKDAAKRKNAPDEGLLIWHVDERGDNSAQDMTATKHYELSVEQADGLFDLEKNKNGRANDLFHAGNKDKFDDTTTPNSKWWNGTASGLKVCDVGALDPSISVTVGCTGTIAPPPDGGTSLTDAGVATGGVVASGGVVATGGRLATGGVVATGGRTALDAGAATGGRIQAMDAAGVDATAATGGQVARTGGVSTGGTGTGGAATGGIATGGTSTGGKAMTGGVVSTGGVATTGGSVSTGGSASGGAKATGGQIATPLTSSSGCSCTVGEARRDRLGVTAMILGLFTFVVLRRRTRR